MPEPASLSSPTRRLSINQLAHRECVHVSSIWRWLLRGVRGHRLRSVRVGGHRFVLECDWLDFNQAINADLAAVRVEPNSTARAERAGHELDELLSSRRGRATNA